jgi:hypothetical protein
MAKRKKYSLTFAPEVVGHLQCIESKYHGLLQHSIAEQLRHTPTAETRNRKPLRQPAPYDAAWELRCGPDNRFRVFYDVDADAHEVRILAIGIKDRQRLIVGEEEFEL